MTVLASQPCIPIFFNCATKKGPRKGGLSLGKNSNFIAYFEWAILSKFYPDYGLCVASVSEINRNRDLTTKTQYFVTQGAT